MRKLSLFILFIIISTVGRSQLDVGIFAGGSFYMGDLNPSYPFLQTNFAYGALGRYNLSSRWAVKVNIYKGILTGDDKKSKFLKERSLKFTSNLWELGGVMEFNFLPYYTGSMKNYYTPYIFGGVAVFYNRPKIGNSDLRDYHTEGQTNLAYLPPDETRKEYSYYNLSFPFGIGVKYSFSKRICITLEWGMRKTFTDYIDDVSKTYYLPAYNIEPGDEEYPDLVVSDPNKNHQPMMQRGNSKTNDWYSFAGMTITYNVNLKNRNKCSEFQDNKY
ncbi:MAG: outer membrane beta-barrel protein [Bacteroidales bacterium]|nr:outer membrane beta-barrel protein [Bacteroidales bacterium]